MLCACVEVGLVLGIVVCCLVLLGIAALVVIGIVWKTLFGRVVWTLLLLGLLSVTTAHLYVWIDAYLPVELRSIDEAQDRSAVISAAVGLGSRLIVFCMLLVFLYFFCEQSSKFLSVLVVCVGVASTLATIASVVYVFASPGLAQAINYYAGRDIIVSQMNCIRIPNAVLGGACFVAAALLCFLFARSFFKGLESADLIRSALKRAFVLAIVLVVGSAILFALGIAELPVFGLTSQALFVGFQVVGVETLLTVCLGLLILNSWTTSKFLNDELEEKDSLLSRSSSSKESAVPLRYADY